MVKNWCTGERGLEEIEGFLTFSGPYPTDTLAGESGKRHRHVGIVSDKPMVEIGEPEERLNVFDFPRGRPVPNDLDFRVVHFESVRADNEPKEVGGVDAEFALLEFGKEAVGAEAA